MKKTEDFYLIQGLDKEGKTVTKPFDDGIVKKICLIRVFEK